MKTLLDKDNLIERLTLALKQLFLDGLDGIDRIAMESSVDRFIIDIVSAMTADDIIDTFYTPENSVRRFMEFLEDSGALEEASGQTIH